jgi:pyruvate, orthophosphate dikinase
MCVILVRFALDVHWRFLKMFGTVVMKVPPQQYEEVLKEERAACGVGDNTQLDIKSLQVVVCKFKALAEVSTTTP